MTENVTKLRDQRAKDGAGAHDPLITCYYADGRSYGKRVQYTTFKKMWMRMLERAGLPTTITSHWGRATAITALLTQGCSYREVQEFSRHASTQMVERYDKRRFDLEHAVQKNLKY